ncbi:LysR family transcriptional regulator [Pseudonocardia sp. GCM10023141]|uniref:LysR family transcriptional regulator n=1 Tax=Pseudonocardia sp. GCM10023141 TaxID=3252653 RepID=UPI00360C0196
MDPDTIHRKSEWAAMDSELLRTFTAVVGSRSFTAAARELGYVQSTVTGHVHTLERQLGARLLDRLPAGAVPTEAGLRLLPYAEQLLDLQARMLADVPAGPGPVAGPVRLLAPESLCAYRLAAFVAGLRAELPEVRLSLGPGGTAAALDAVRRGSVDIALVLEPALTAADVVLEPIGAEELLLLAAPTLLPARELAWADLAGHDTLLLEDGCSYSDDVARQLLAAGQPAARRTRFGSIETVKHCVAAGLGWTVLPAVTVGAEVRAGALEVVPGPALTPCGVLLATHPGRLRGPATELVLDRLHNLW